jgi:hypothetical protein
MDTDAHVICCLSTCNRFFSFHFTLNENYRYSCRLVAFTLVMVLLNLQNQFPHSYYGLVGLYMELSGHLGHNGQNS